MSVHEVADEIARLGGIIAGMEKELIAERIMREHADLEAETAREQRDAAHVLRDATVAQYRDRARAAEQRIAELEAALLRIAQMKDYGAAVEAVQALARPIS